HCVDQMNRVTSLGKPERIRARRAANIEYDGRGRRRVALNQFASAQFLKSGWALRKAIFFTSAIIILRNVWVDLHSRRNRHSDLWPSPGSTWGFEWRATAFTAKDLHSCRCRCPITRRQAPFARWNPVVPSHSKLWPKTCFKFLPALGKLKVGRRG